MHTYTDARCSAWLIVFVLLLIPGRVLGQESEPEDGPETPPEEAEEELPVRPRWESDVVGKLAGSQSGFSNWAKGGANSLALATGLSSKFALRTENWQQRHDVQLAFGVVKQDTLAFRKADDEINLASSLQYRGDGFFRLFNPTTAVQVRTQFAPGFNYKKNPFDDGLPPPVKVSDFFSPAVFTQTLGLTYDPSEWFTQRFGVAGKQTVVLIPRFRALYGVPESGSVLAEVGIESRSKIERELFDNVFLKSSLGLFAAFNNPEVPDMMWENRLAMKVNSWLSVDVEADVLYDRDISTRLQLREVFRLGISMVFI